MTYVCPVCGFDGLEEPVGPPASSRTYEICPSCGFEFGVTDDDKGYSYKEWRQRWVSLGMVWWDEEPPPAGWDPQRQLRRVAS